MAAVSCCASVQQQAVMMSSRREALTAGAEASLEPREAQKRGSSVVMEAAYMAGIRRRTSQSEEVST